LHAIKVGTTDDDDNRLKEIELEDYKRDLRTICQAMLAKLEIEEKPINFQPLTKVVRRLMIPEPITRFCGVAGTYLGIDANGSVYPCFRHLGLDEYLLGDVSGSLDDTKRSNFRKQEAADVDNRTLCKDCWARYVCGGGCYADSTILPVNQLMV
jgi:uncharacterized protein